MKDLKDKVAVVTGASLGIGRAIAISLAREGCTVALIARGKDGLDKVAKEIRDDGGKALVFPCDVSDLKRLAETIKAIEIQLARIESDKF